MLIQLLLSISLQLIHKSALFVEIVVVDAAWISIKTILGAVRYDIALTLEIPGSRIDIMTLRIQRIVLQILVG